MNLEHFERFTRLLELGKRHEATIAIRAFIDSFISLEEKRRWSETYLNARVEGKIIRHEIFESVIFPVLLNGYRKSDPWSLRWLARTSENLYKSKQLWREVEMKTEFSFLAELLALYPADEITRIELLAHHVKGLQYAVHEWPSGILYGSDSATIQECDEIFEDLMRARALDLERLHEVFFADFESKLVEYTTRLKLKLS